jgi:hypothetical protein
MVATYDTALPSPHKAENDFFGVMVRLGNLDQSVKWAGKA